MNDFHLITVPTFSAFVAEVGPVGRRPIRLCLGEKYAPEKYGTGDNAISVPARQATLDVQGFNCEGELVWLSRSLTVHWSNEGPAAPDDQDRYDGMRELRRIVLEALEGWGYEVRPGRYVLPDAHSPLNGYFDCAEWYRDEEGHIKVRGVDENFVVCSTARATRFEVDLEDGCLDDAPAFPMEIRADENSVLLRIPATPDGGLSSAAEVYVEHYGGRVTVYVRDQETMIADPDGDATASIVLLADSANREVLQ